MPYKCFLFPLKRKLCTLSEPTQCWRRNVNKGGNNPYVLYTGDENEDNWNTKCDQNTALYLQVWNQSLPSCSVLPNLHHCPAHPWDFQMMAVFEDLLPICTAPIQAFFCNLFPILLLLWHSHQNFSLDVDYSTPEILQYLLLSLHFSLSSPNHICPALGGHPSSHAHAHTFWLTPRATLAFSILFKTFGFTFYGPADKHSVASLLTSSYCIHLLSVFHQFSFFTHVLHAKLRKQQQPKKDLKKGCGYYPLVP